MKPSQDLTGQRFGKLVAVSPIKVGRRARWRFKCDCGNDYEGMVQSIRRGVRHCLSCANAVRAAKAVTHGQCRGERSRLYNIWVGMRGRCNNERDKVFYLYGGRGIKVCAEWDEYPAFRAWAEANGYTDNLTIDRIDGNRGYEPDNCRWVTQADQARNTSACRLFDFRGETLTLYQIAERVRLPYPTLNNRIKRGLGVEDAISHKPYAPIVPSRRRSAVA